MADPLIKATDLLVEVLAAQGSKVHNVQLGAELEQGTCVIRLGDWAIWVYIFLNVYFIFYESHGCIFFMSQ